MTDFKDTVTASASFWGSKTILQLSAALSSSVLFILHTSFIYPEETGHFYRFYSCSCALDLLARSEV